MPCSHNALVTTIKRRDSTQHNRKRTRVGSALLLLWVVFVPRWTLAADTLVAVAANFAPVATSLKARFESQTDHHVRLAAGSTGKLYAQIRNGAPFDLLLAADQQRPALLEAAGATVAESRFTYARGRLGVWQPAPTEIQSSNVATLRAQLVRAERIAIANPDLAPYGIAAMEVFARLDLSNGLQGRLAMAENVAQAYAMVASGAAQIGLVAWSHVTSRDNQPESWLIPQSWHRPIRQDAVLLLHGADNQAARAFLAYLRSPAAQTIIASHGYLVDG